MTGHLQQLRLRAYHFHKVPPMAVNPYAPCPCGSGKKFKFCCQDVQADLMRVVSLSRNQPEIALNQMQQLAAKHPDRESVLRELVVMLLRHNRLQDALKACTDFLKAHPDNPQILLIYADICVQCSGFDASRRIVHRAFQVCTRQFPVEVSNIAARIGLEMFRRGMIPAAREHALLAVRLAGTEKSEVALSHRRRQQHPLPAQQFLAFAQLRGFPGNSAAARTSPAALPPGLLGTRSHHLQPPG